MAKEKKIAAQSEDKSLFFKDILKCPEDYYQSPYDLAADGRLTHTQRKAALKSWEWDVKELLVAEEENMQGPNQSAAGLLQDIQKILSRMKL